MAGITLERISCVFDAKTVLNDVNLTVEDGEFLVIVGPSGCGKSTLLRIIAGLTEPSEGRVLIGPPQDANSLVNHVAPKDRDVAMVFQNYALYPHMTVMDNLAFALKMRGVSKAERTQRVNAVAEQLKLTELLKRKPAQLSGGQRQRVALGRAMVRNPRVFLMDEPLSNLDANLRQHTRGELADLHRRLGVTTLYVTHDQVEAMTLGQRIAVIHEGRIQQIDTPMTVYRQPATLFVANFMGPFNTLPALILKDALVLEGFNAPPLVLSAPQMQKIGEATSCLVGFRPEDAQLKTFKDSAIDNALSQYQLQGVVSRLERHGSETLVSLTLTTQAAGAEATMTEHTIMVRTSPHDELSLGEIAQVSLTLEMLQLFPR
ncbi:MAG: ABC transporter ATP-binding protein [Vampirovibrionales bacterium]|nr:ABC transporter ATP-binding protein [Vampirovibrionales bacterium]